MPVALLGPTLARLKQGARSLTNVHRPDGSPNVLLFALPRGGSTWLMELIWSQPGFKCCDEPTDLRNPLVRRHLGLDEWDSLYSPEATATLAEYFRGFCDGDLHFMDPRPFRRYYRPLTRRIVFKIIHGCEDRINWFRDVFNGRIVYLIRHPIAVALSREVYPTLPALLETDYRRHFSAEQLAFAEDIRASGSKLERGVLSWCLQVAVPLRQRTPDWAFVSYEQLVIDPLPVVEYLAQKLDLPDPERMVRALAVPSNVKHKSDAATQRVLESGAMGERLRLVDKWRKRVSEVEERRAIEILERFEIDLYRFGDSLPAQQAWIAPRPSAGHSTPS